MATKNPGGCDFVLAQRTVFYAALCRELRHGVRVRGPLDGFFRGSSVELWMEIKSLLDRWFLLLDWNAVRVGPGILANARYLP